MTKENKYEVSGREGERKKERKRKGKRERKKKNKNKKKKIFTKNCMPLMVVGRSSTTNQGNRI